MRIWQTTINITRLIGIAALALSTSFGAQEIQASESEVETLKTEIKRLADELTGMTSDKNCQTDQDCAAVGIGHRPCGGPSQYLVFSKLKTNEIKIKQIAAQHRDAQRKVNQLLGLISTCEFLPEPPVACVDQQCAALTP
jgi:hypothetical protein